VTESMVMAARLMELDALAEYVPPEVLAERLVEMVRQQAGVAEADVERLRRRLAASAAGSREEPVATGPAEVNGNEVGGKRVRYADLKICTRCDEAKPLDAFRPNEHTASGRDSRCIECLEEPEREREAEREGAEASEEQPPSEAGGEARRCQSCGELKPLKSFHGAKSTRCRTCVYTKRGAAEEAPAGSSPTSPSASEPGGEETASERPEGLKKLIVKRCERCDKKKPLAQFKKTSKTPDGYTHACSACLRQLDSNKDYYREADL
jgi:hypothetical protein